MKTLRKRIRGPTKNRNRWGGLMADHPGGVERDEERRKQEMKEVRLQMDKTATPTLDKAP